MGEAEKFLAAAHPQQQAEPAEVACEACYLRAMVEADPQQPAQPLTQREIDAIVYASREADEGPTELLRRVEAKVRGTATQAPAAEKKG
jgi:hypothetical protein